MCICYMQIHTILYKGLEHLRILEFVKGPEINPPQLLRDKYNAALRFRGKGSVLYSHD